jgi:hypothetical protein
MKKFALSILLFSIYAVSIFPQNWFAGGYFGFQFDSDSKFQSVSNHSLFLLSPILGFKHCIFDFGINPRVLFE